MRLREGRRALGDFLEFFGIAAEEEDVGEDDFVGADLEAALFDDRCDGAVEVLVGAHAAGDAVEDDAEVMGFHGQRFLYEGGAKGDLA